MEIVSLTYHRLMSLAEELNLERTITFKCPHCGKGIGLIASSDEYSDDITLHFGKEIEELKQELKKEFGWLSED